MEQAEGLDYLKQLVNEALGAMQEQHRKDLREQTKQMREMTDRILERSTAHADRLVETNINAASHARAVLKDTLANEVVPLLQMLFAVTVAVTQISGLDHRKFGTDVRRQLS